MPKRHATRSRSGAERLTQHVNTELLGFVPQPNLRNIILSSYETTLPTPHTGRGLRFLWVWCDYFSSLSFLGYYPAGKPPVYGGSLART